MRSDRSIKISGDKLAQIWRESLLSGEAFAEKIGVGRTNLGRLVSSGVHGVLKDRFARMAAGLGMMTAELKDRIGADESELQATDADAPSDVDRIVEEIKSLEEPQRAALWDRLKAIENQQRKTVRQAAKKNGK